MRRKSSRDIMAQFRERVKQRTNARLKRKPRTQRTEFRVTEDIGFVCPNLFSFVWIPLTKVT